MNTKTILLCDDNKDVGLIFKIVFKKLNIRVETAINGKEAISYLHSFPKTGLIILDLKMPQMGGVEFLKIRKNDPILKAVPVILLSGNVDVSEIAREYDIPDYIEKGRGDVDFNTNFQVILEKYFPSGSV